MSNFFIERPIFAWVLAILTILAGVISIYLLPVNQYPDIAPPEVSISVIYPGASAEAVQNSVVQVIEQNLSGLDGLRYIKSSSNQSVASITVTFEQGVDPDLAQVQVQNKVQQASSSLPTEVVQQGVVVSKSSSSFLLLLSLISEDNSYSNADLNDYMNSTIKDIITRVPGVGSVQVFGSSYAMRIWLDPLKLQQYNLIPTDVSESIKSQNIQVSFGQLGEQPVAIGHELNASVIGRSRFTTTEEFENILLKTSDDGSQVKLKDVATVELGAESYGFIAKYNGMYSAGMAVSAAVGANSLEVAKNIEQTVKEQINPYLPSGMRVAMPYDTTPVISASILGVIRTLLEAIALVFVVMFLFLQDWRATLIPTLAIPVVLAGTAVVMLLLGLTINTLTMFAMVLAIGLLVDDAIVVVENVERIMHEEGLGPVEATKKSMGQIQGALFGIAMVLSAVFLPMAFFPGSAGVIYRQFSVAIVTSMGLSVLVALIFTPALCATMIKPIEQGSKHEKSGFFGWFNRFFNKTSHGYRSAVAFVLRFKTVYVIMYVFIIAGILILWRQIPKSFLPDEDQGVMFVLVSMPENTTIDNTEKAVEQVRQFLLNDEKDIVKTVFTVSGFSFIGRGQNTAMGFVMLKPWEERREPEKSVKALQMRAFARFMQIPDATIYPILPPSVSGLGNATGFNFFLQDHAGNGHQALQQAMGAVMGASQTANNITGLRPSVLPDVSQYKLEVDEERARSLKINPASVYSNMAISWGSAYVNDFMNKGRVKRVYMQSKSDARMNPEDLSKWYARNGVGDMVSYASFMKGEWIKGPPSLTRYNSVQAIEFSGEAAAGFSTGEAMDTMSKIVAGVAQKTGNAVGLSWTGLSFEEIKAGSMQTYLYALSLIVIFLCLAALYESWSVPFAVIFSVPLGVLGALALTQYFGLKNDVFFQIGLLTTIGLTARNAILIVEFARDLHESGLSLFEASIEACRMRLRPIVMTSFAFILGVLPLVIASGASAASKHAIGIGVMGGMITALILAIFWIPLFYVIFAQISDYFNGNKKGHKQVDINKHEQLA